MAEAPRPALTDAEICRQAKERMQATVDWETAYRPLAREDLRFSLGDQWPDEYRTQREGGDVPRPCLVINRLEEMILQVVNDFRLQRPGIVVRPIDDSADIATAEIVQGIIRQIERTSDADVAYDTGIDHATRIGRGYWRIVLQFEHPESFDLVPFIRRIRNPFSVYMDPVAQQPDGSDATWGLIAEDMRRDEFERCYPNADVSNFPALMNDPTDDWVTRDTVRVAEYFFIEWTAKTLARTAGGSVFLKDLLPSDAEIVEERPTQIPKVWQVKLSGAEVLETFAWPGRFIPIIPTLGVEMEVDGKLRLKGITRNGADPQRMINYWASTETELIALTPKAPHIGPEGFMEGHEIAWREANIRNIFALQYKPTQGPNGQLNPPPQRQTFEPPVQAITQQRMMAMDDLHGTTGVHPPALGQEIPQASGTALRQQQGRADVSNLHYSANGGRAIRQTGRILVDIIPPIYDKKRVVRIVGQDDIEELVTINAPTERDGVKAEFKVGMGRYDVSTEAGPSLSTRRQEAAEGMVRLTQAYPEFARLIGDIMVRSMDFPEAQEAAERIRRTIPPEVLGTDEEPSPEQMRAMIKQLQTQLQQLNAYAQEREQELSQAEERSRVLKLENEDKSKENEIKLGQLELDRQELKLKTQTENRKLDIEEQTKNRSLAIETAELALEASDAGA